jgi:ribosomal protein S20
MVTTVRYMPRQKQPTTTRSIRLIEEVASAVDTYADKELISSNAAVNKLLRDRLIELGYINS